MIGMLKKIFGGNSTSATGSSSIQGRKPAQEDSFFISDVCHGMRLVFVADGVGGHGHGDFASQKTVQVFREAFGGISVDTDIEAFLRDTAISAATQVLDKANDDPAYKNCGTTLSGFLVAGRQYRTINIGDSRVYLWTQDTLCRETHDHSIVQQLLDSGEITEDEAFHHPQRNMMTSAIGQPLHMMKIDISQPRQLKDGDILFCFSDGVHDALTDNQIFSLISRYKDSGDLATRITDAAYNAGGKDNITAVLYRYWE